MTDFDELPFAPDPGPPSFTGAVGKPAKCRRHPAWVTPATCSRVGCFLDEPHCVRCGTIQDAARSRRGKSARNRGNSYERELALRLGGKRVGQYGGPDDVTTSLFTCQVKVRKAFPYWLTNEIDKLPRSATKTPILVVADAPGPGRKRRAIVVVDLADWTDLHGEVTDGTI